MGFFGTNAALGKIDRDISAIAEGQADLSHPVGTGGNDVYGRISGNITRFFGRVRSLISHSREQSVSIAAVRPPARNHGFLRFFSASLFQSKAFPLPGSAASKR